MSQIVGNAVVACPFYREYSRSFFGLIRALARYFLVSDKNKILASDKKKSCIYVASGDGVDKVKGNLDTDDASNDSSIFIESMLVEGADSESEEADADESPTRMIHFDIHIT